LAALGAPARVAASIRNRCTTAGVAGVLVLAPSGYLSAPRETPYFAEAERAALALTESGTRMADRPDPVPDDLWDEAARHYDQAQLAALVIAIATINAFNRINATTRQVRQQPRAERFLHRRNGLTKP
jgi:hypothetical protein